VEILLHVGLRGSEAREKLPVWTGQDVRRFGIYNPAVLYSISPAKRRIGRYRTNVPDNEIVELNCHLLRRPAASSPEP
jgi:hypothetical protein